MPSRTETSFADAPATRAFAARWGSGICAVGEAQWATRSTRFGAPLEIKNGRKKIIRNC